MAITCNFVLKRTNLLAMTQITALAAVNITAREFKRRIWTYTLDDLAVGFLNGGVDPEQWGDLNEPPH
jgi:hypothetical protein